MPAGFVAPEFYFLPPLLTMLEQNARGIRIEIANFPVDWVSAAMHSGKIDLALGYVPGLDPGCVSRTLLVDEHVCVVRAGHPLRKQKPTKEDLAGLRCVYASTNATGHRMVEQWLEELNLRRDIVLRLPHFVVAPEIVQHTDLAVIFPSRGGPGHCMAPRCDLHPVPSAFGRH